MMKEGDRCPRYFLLHFRKRNGHPIPESALRRSFTSFRFKSRRRAVDVLATQALQTSHMCGENWRWRVKKSEYDLGSIKNTAGLHMSKNMFFFFFLISGLSYPLFFQVLGGE